jgi:hypothetical protein
VSRHEYDDETVDHGPIADDEFIDRLIDTVCRRVNLEVVDEQAVATVVSITLAHLHVSGYHLV